MAPMSKPSDGGFRLTKWYVDCLDAGGRVAIAYWVSLRYRTLGFAWSSVAVYEPDRPVRRTSALGRAAEPRLDGRSLTWRDPAIETAVEAEVLQAGTSVQLFARGAGSVEWTCAAPAADVSLRAPGGALVRGRGYAERLVLTLPPWQLPIRELRWGRWIATEARRSLVWIDWRGPASATWVLRDGALCPGATVTNTDVCAGGERVAIGARQLLHSRRLDDVLGGIAPLRRLVPAAVLAIEDTRWASRAPLQSPDGASVTGAAIAELVRVP
jgi:hypothetical protein